MVNWACPALCYWCPLSCEFVLCYLPPISCAPPPGRVCSLPASHPWRSFLGSAVEMRRNRLSKSFEGRERLAQGDGFLFHVTKTSEL